MESHHHHYTSHNRAFLIGVALNLAFVIVEAACGLITDSLALVADAGHNLGDVLGLVLAWGGALLANRRATARRTYGWRRATIMAALLNAVILYLAVGAIGWEAVRRLFDPPRAAGSTVMIVAGAGIVINTATALMFAAGRRTDLNVGGAFLHMAADAVVSAGVVLAGLGIVITGWLWLDPAISLVVAGVILAGTWRLMRESVNLAMDAVPAGIDAGRINRYLEGLPGVTRVHDLHIWAMSTTETALTAHLEHHGSADTHRLTREVGSHLEHHFGIVHSTLQWERVSGNGQRACGTECGLSPAAERSSRH